MQSMGWTIDRLLADESFINFCKGTSEVDIAFWEAYIKNNPAQKALVESAKATFIELFNVIASADLEEQAVKLSNKLDIEHDTPVIPLISHIVHKKKSFLFLAVKCTVAACILLVSGYYIWGFTIQSNKPLFNSYITQLGERKNVQLPDGTFITLNAGSKLEIGKDYGKLNRDVTLTGEAFFDVKRNKNLPFIVHTYGMTVKALGTAFNVKAYSEEQEIETSLIRGLVEVTVKNTHPVKLILHPNQKVNWRNPSLSKGNESLFKLNDTTAGAEEKKWVQDLAKSDRGEVEEIAWLQNKLVFSDNTLEEISTTLKRWYGINIEFNDDAVRQYRFTGTFEKEKLETILAILKESRSFHYEIVPGTILTVKLSK